MNALFVNAYRYATGYHLKPTEIAAARLWLETVGRGHLMVSGRSPSPDRFARFIEKQKGRWERHGVHGVQCQKCRKSSPTPMCPSCAKRSNVAKEALVLWLTTRPPAET